MTRTRAVSRGAQSSEVAQLVQQGYMVSALIETGGWGLDTFVCSDFRSHMAPRQGTARKSGGVGKAVDLMESAGT